jgi:hypothetical protein
MSQTRKDSFKHAFHGLEIVKNQDGTFEFFLDRERMHSGMSLRSLEEELCVRFGYCGQEFVSILEEVERDGRKTMLL